MICLPVMARSNADMCALLEAASAEPADVYELRLDSLDEPADIKHLLAAADKPVVVTCRSAGQGGGFRGAASERAAVLQQAIDAGAAFVDAEEDVVRLIQKREGTTVIASWHDFTSTPGDLDAVVARLAALPCDWVKFAVMATKQSDNIAVLDALSRSEKPAIGIAMGEIGLPSRILGPAYGSRITFGTLSGEHQSAPGQPTARELADVYRVKKLSRDTAVYGLLGDPVRHSFGYRIHNLGFALSGLDAVFIPFQCAEAEDFWLAVPNGLNLQGLSVTMPYKRTAYAWADAVGKTADAVGVANTLVREAGRWRSENTDFLAVAAAVAEKAAANGLDLRGKKALVLGGGGAARAVGAALASIGCLVSVSGRSADKTEQLAARTGWTSVPWDERERAEWSAVANATPVGMYPASDATPYSAAAWKRGMLAFDAVYRPRETRFLREAAATGAVTADGLEMFVRQAEEQFTIWTGKPMPRECRALAERLACEKK